MKSRLFLAAALISLLATGCQKEETTDLGEVVKTPLTITANYGKSNAKVSYTENGNTISASWDAGDKILVAYDGYVSELTLVSGAGTASATFTGTISHSVAHTPTRNSILSCYVKDNNDNVTLTIEDDNIIYSDASFMSQEGTVASAGKCNTYHGMTSYGDGTNITCDFAVNTSIMKFNVPFIDADAGKTASLTYISGTTEVCKATFTVGGNANVIYLAIPAGQYSGEQKLVYRCNNNDYTYQLSATQANFTAGQTYSKTVEYPLYVPLTFEAKEANSTVTFTGSNSVKYSINGGSWQDYNSAISLPNVGDKVYFRGTNSSYLNSNITCSEGQCYIYGNVMSLINATEYPTIKNVGYKAFMSFFNNDANIFNHPNKDLLLPATTLDGNCYKQMFQNCTNLTRAPKLPATIMKPDCYGEMFSGCTSLTTAPALPATTLDIFCYNGMFSGCTSLTTAPALPAETMKNNCYYAMFSGCTSLTMAPALPATTLNAHCYGEMFSGCTSLTTAPALPAESLQFRCYYEMFKGCTSLTTASYLPATTLAEGCYYEMFIGCTSLSTAPALPATALKSDCYMKMFSGCTSLTTAHALPAETLATNCYRSMFYGCTSLTTAPVLPAPTLVSGCYMSMFEGCSSLNWVECRATSGIDNGQCLDLLRNVAPSGTFRKPANSDWSSVTYGIPNNWTVENL